MAGKDRMRHNCGHGHDERHCYGKLPYCVLRARLPLCLFKIRRPLCWPPLTRPPSSFALPQHSWHGVSVHSHSQRAAARTHAHDLVSSLSLLL